jgi:hypothetical protein
MTLFQPGMPVMFTAHRGGGVPVQHTGVVVSYPRKPHPTAYALVKVSSGYVVEVHAENLSGVEYDTRLPLSACEDDAHTFAGQCTRECADLVDMMLGDGYTEPQVYGDYLGGTSSVDVSGCHGGPQQATYVAHYDAAARAVALLYLHDPGCQCGRPACPEVLAEAAWLASPEGQAWTAEQDARRAALAASGRA